MHCFGATLNAHVHLHLCMLDGVVVKGWQGLAFRGAQVDEACGQWVLGLFERRGLLSSETIAGMQGWGHRGGFSVHPGVWIAAQDRVGRERLLRYWVRPMFAGERLVWAGGGGQVRYRLPWAGAFGSVHHRAGDGSADTGIGRRANNCTGHRPARSPPREMKSARQLTSPEVVFVAFPELEFDQMANLRAEARHDRLGHNAGVDAVPIPEPEFDQTMGWKSCAAEVAHAAAHGMVWIRRWRGAVSIVGCQCWSMEVVQYALATRTKPLRVSDKSGL